MVEAIRDLERRISRKFRSAPWYEHIERNFRRLVQNGLRSEDDLSRMALDPSLDPSIQAGACWFLARLSPRRVSSPVLFRLLAESPPAVRVEAASSLGIIKSKKALPALIDMALHEREATVRESSIYAPDFFRTNALSTRFCR